MAEELENQDDATEETEQEIEEVQEDERLTKRKKKTDSRRKQAIIRVALLIGIIIFVNIIAVKIYFRLDLTGNKIYTLSDASRQVVKNIDDKVVVKSYFTDNLPSPYNNTRRYLQEILDDYKNYSNGNFQYEIISPSDQAELEKDAEKYGIQAVQVQTFKNDRAEAMKAYMGLVMLYGGKQEVLPFLGNIQNLEYELTGAIRRLTEKQLKKIGILSGQNIPGQDKIGKASEFLSKYYSVVPVDVSKNNPIPADISVLIVFTPKQEQQQQQQQQQQAPPTMPENLKFAIDQYIMNGGKVIFLMNTVNVASQQQFQFGQVVKTGIEDMLESYGIKITSNIITDKNCAAISVPVQMGGMQMYTQVPFPYFPKITNINKDLPAFSGIGQIFLAFSSDIDTSIAMFKGLKTTPLLITSNKTGVYKDIALIQTSGQMMPDSMFKYSSLTLGAIFTGKYKSFYTGKKPPADTITGSSPAPDSTKTKMESPDTKVIVIGNSDFVKDEFRGPDENILFFANMIDYLADDIGLSAIRLKDANPKPLDPIEDGTKNILKYGLLVGPPVIVLLVGLFRWRKRKSMKS